MKVFVTGATGLLGRAVVNELHARGHETRSLIHATAIARDDPFSQTDIVWGDISRVEEHGDYLKGCDAVVHCAWNFVRSDDVEEYREKNIDPAVSLLRSAAVHGINKFITISSVSVYGLDPTEDGHPYGENDLFCSYDDAMDVYPRAKQESEKALSAAARDTGISTSIIRPGLLYSDTTAPVKKSIKGKVALVAGMGNNHLPYIHVNSVAELVLDVLESPKNNSEIEVLNAVPAHNDTARAVLKRWKKKTSSSAKIVYLPAPAFKLLALSPYFIKKALKKQASMPNYEYQTKTGTRNVSYSAQKAYDTYGWVGY